MNWQCVSTRPTASSTVEPSRRRWAAMSMNGMFSIRRCWFMEPCKGWDNIERWSLTDKARPLAGRRARSRLGRIFQAADRDLEAGDALVAGHRRMASTSHGAQERHQLGAQRLVMADRQMAHRVAAIGLEAETFRHLARQQIAHHIFAA